LRIMQILPMATKHVYLSLHAWQKLAVMSLFVALALTGCGGNSDAPVTPRLEYATLKGQVNLSSVTPASVSAYAAARFLEQASWGPTPQAIEEVQRLGIEGWLDRQLATPPSVLNAPGFVINHDSNNRAEQDMAWTWRDRSFIDLGVSGPDQLRQRVSWAIFNYIPITGSQPYGDITYFNALQTHALGSYKSLLKAVTLHSAMGHFLNNNQNTADQPNENFARELMQLFSVGLVLLNDDGTVKRDSSGKAIETYSQTDVREATRALSGWNNDWQKDLPTSNFGNFGKPMIPRTWPSNAHDAGQKQLLGQTIRANQSIDKDLDQVLDILVSHPNTGPFVATRLIQHLVASDPSPSYVSRVAQVFARTNGDLKQTVRAVLLDPDARNSDVLGRQTPRAGRMKDRLLFSTGTLRALGCRAVPMVSHWDDAVLRPVIGRDNPPSVFGFFSPFHRAPESLVLAPEQRLLGRSEVNSRGWLLSNLERSREGFVQAGCEVALFEQAAKESDESLLTLVNNRFFRGSMPPPIQRGGRDLLATELADKSPSQKTSGLLEALLLTPSYGVVK
jgi:uncharacterized protein (DUF1800 family)